MIVISGLISSAPRGPRRAWANTVESGFASVALVTQQCDIQIQTKPFQTTWALISQKEVASTLADVATSNTSGAHATKSTAYEGEMKRINKAGTRMQRNSVLFIGPSPGGFGKLGSELNRIGLRVLLANSFDDARLLLEGQMVGLAVANLDCATFDEIQQLARHWGVGVICIHHLPDDELWVKSLAAGAIDCCHVDNHAEILQALVSFRPCLASPSVEDAIRNQDDKQVR